MQHRRALGPFRRINGRWVSIAPKSVAARAIALALKDQGYTESPAGSNMTKYGARWSQNGVAWCGMAIASWWRDAGFAVSRTLALQIDYVPTLIRLATQRSHGLFLVGRNRVRRGDAVAYDFPGGERGDHVGLFVRWVDRKAGVFLAIEGNTSKEGSQSNGGAVLLKVRTMDQVAAFVRMGRVAA